MASAGAAQARSVWIEGFYGQSALPLSDLNSYRANFLWNNTTASEGRIVNPTYSGGSLGGGFLFHTILSFRYENTAKNLRDTLISGASYTVADSLLYESVSLNMDLPVNLDSWMFTIGGGVGYALTYQFHQTLTGGTGDDVIWQAHPMAYRGRITLGYRLFHSVVLFGEGIYENVRSGLTAYKDYQTTSGGSPIGIGQELHDQSGKRVIMDMSGLRYAVGLRLIF